MPDREKAMEALEHCSDRTQKRCNPTCPYHNRNFCETELASDTLAMLKEQEDLGTELTNAVELIHKKNERIEKLLKEREEIVRCKDCRYGQHCTDGETTYQCFKWNSGEFGVLHEQNWFCADGERAEAGAEDPEDNQGNNGPLKEIRPEEVMDGLRRLAGSGVLGENWREILADAMTLIWLRYER